MAGGTEGSSTREDVEQPSAEQDLSWGLAGPRSHRGVSLPGHPALGRNETEQVISEPFGCYCSLRCLGSRGRRESVTSTGLRTCVLGSGRSLKSGRCCCILRVPVCKLYRQRVQAGLVGGGKIRPWGCPCEGSLGRLTWVFLNELSSLLKYS